jgi:acylphosphatase
VDQEARAGGESRGERPTERWLISGRVQGVGYRAFVRERALALGVAGWVRNLRDGRVEAEVVGDDATLGELERVLRRGPVAARVDQLQRTPCAPAEELPARFEVRRTV